MNRIDELEKKATDLYLNEIQWNLIIEMLPKEEQEEYWGIVNDK